MADRHDDDLWLEFAASTDSAETVTDAPARLKANIFSRLNLEQAKQGPLASLGESKAAGRSLCVFEEIVEYAPTGEAIKRMNYCRVCHARVLAENMDSAPIWWHGCPYAQFQK
jgi:hypothetical protein